MQYTITPINLRASDDTETCDYLYDGVAIVIDDETYQLGAGRMRRSSGGEGDDLVLDLMEGDTEEAKREAFWAEVVKQYVATNITPVEAEQIEEEITGTI